MAFNFRTFSQVFADAVAYVRANSQITDFNIGSVARSMLEATSLELASVYVQLARFRDFFNLDLASGDDLTERALEYGCRRAAPSNARVGVTFSDSLVSAKVSSTLSAGVAAAVTSVTLVDASDFPASGYVILEREDAAKRERVFYSGKIGNVLTFPTSTSRAHAAGVSVILSQQGVDRYLPIGTAVRAPGAGTDGADIAFRTVAEAVVLDGDATSEEVVAVAELAGAAQMVIAETISDFASRPWTTARVTNLAPSTGGFDQESDEKLRIRCRAAVQLAARGTVTAIERAALSTYIVDGAQCNSVQLIEPVSPANPMTLYVHDGSATNGFVTYEDIAKEIVAVAPPAGQTRVRTRYWPILSGTLKIRKALHHATSNKRGYGSDGFCPALGTYDDLSRDWAVNQFAGMYLVDANGDVFLITSNTATRLTLTSTTGLPAAGPYGIFDLNAAVLAEGTDFTLNRTTGEIEFTSELNAYQMVLAYDDVLGNAGYRRYTGLVAEVQKVINGVTSDRANYAGYRAAGTQCVVLPPVLDSLDLIYSVTPQDDVVESTALHTEVEQIAGEYINSLGIGEPWVYAEAIARTQRIPGVKDTRITVNTISSPTNVEPLPGHLIRPNSITVN